MESGRWRRTLPPSRALRAFCRAGVSGFTLIELLITVAIIAILAAVALPNYYRHVLHSNRVAAENVMLDIASAEERFLIDNRTYATTLQQLGYTVANTVSPNYNVVISAAGTAPPSFTVTATPQAGQVKDTACNVLQYTSAGSKTANGTSPTQCWN